MVSDAQILKTQTCFLQEIVQKERIQPGTFDFTLLVPFCLYLVTRVLVGVLVLVVVGGPYAHSHPHTGGRPRPVGTQLPWLQGHLKPQKPQKPLLAFFIMSLMLASNVSFTLIHRGVKNGI